MGKMSDLHIEEQENPTWGNKTSYRNPVFQKRHYEFLADLFRAVGMEKSMVEKIANKFAKSNPLFDKQKFLDRIYKW